jgi:hypothetical protein
LHKIAYEGICWRTHRVNGTRDVRG